MSEKQKRAEDSPGLPAVPLSVKEGFTLSCSWLIGFSEVTVLCAGERYG